MRMKKKSASKKSIKSTKISGASKLKSISEKQTRVEILRAIAEETGLTAKQVKDVFATACAMAKRHMMKRGSGEFSIPEMAIKINRKTRPATKKRMGRNPRTGESVMIAARPKREVIKVRALKSLKEALA
ncbi:MAG: HU family DNA-binding protein [Gammaproteobacteria bacterium]|nr:HU family DNA-binding protein [Gammaproteobacteria bacterium]